MPRRYQRSILPRLGTTSALPRAMPNNPDDARIPPIGNLPPINATDEDFPDRYKLELYRLRTKLRHLEADIKDKDNRLVISLATLNDELMFWRTGLQKHVWESVADINKRMHRIAKTIEQIKDIQPHVVPPLEIPARWKKSE